MVLSATSGKFLLFFLFFLSEKKGKFTLLFAGRWSILFFVFFGIFCQALYSLDKTYKIVIDPGHGGANQKPYREFGDKYDPISGQFLEPYKAGAEYKERKEREIVLDLAKELKSILDLTKTSRGRVGFREILQKYTKDPVLPVRFDSVLTREDDYTYYNWNEGEDKNYKYRLFDFVDKNSNQKVLGRLSKINRERPYLVVSLHLNPAYPGHSGGMAAVIAPPYRVFQELRLISRGKLEESVFHRSPYRNWTKFVPEWTHLQNAIADTWIYFHGYWPDQSGTEADLSKFSGYRHNMVTWAFSDDPGWENQAVIGGKGQYARKHSDFLARGKFWNRERGQGESWRRDGGPEGYGGDNLYAGNELLRFVHYGLSDRLRNQDGKPPEIGPIHLPFISTYSLPTYVNAIVAYLEIGYIDNERDMYYLEKNRRIVAESLAAGIYSLFAGMRPVSKKDLPYIPKGKKLGFEKYENIRGKNYFQIVFPGN